MANVFISHSSVDAAWADKIHGWLVTDGQDVFLDQDQGDGIVVGEEWEQRLYERLRWADAVVCLLTPSYLASVWCAGEIGAARALGIEIMPVRIGSGDDSHKLLESIQAIDVSESPEGARKQILARLNVIDGGGGLGWPDDKSPYPGLRSFELGEHRVFFGRGSEITAIAERLRSPGRNTAAILTVVGPSGCGKSSLIRAGVTARIAGEGYWLVVPPIVPGTDPLGSLARAFAEVVRDRKLEFDTAGLREQMDTKGIKRIATDLLFAAKAEARCKLLLVIDQFEELVTQTEPSDRAKFVACLSPALGGPIQVIATVRPEYLDALARDASLRSLTLRLQPISPLDHEALRSVIEQPARVAGLRFEDGLVERLITDTGTGDALPLLAFTLQELARDVGRGGQLTLQRYADIGGVQGALRQQADEALQTACTATGRSQEQVIADLLDLVTIDEEGHPSKRRVEYDESSTALAGLQPFLDGRLLTTETVRNTTLVAVAHDSILVNWPPLKNEIDAHVSALRARRVVENAARDWVAANHDRAALLQGRPLAKAMEDTGAKVEPFQSVLRDVARVPLRPRRRRLTTRVDLDSEAQDFLEVSAARDRSRRLRRLLEVVAVMLTLIATAGAMLVQRNHAQANAIEAKVSAGKADDSAREAIAQKLIADARVHLQHSADAGYLQQLLVGKNLASSTSGDPLYQVVVDAASTYKIMQNPTRPGGGPGLVPMESMAVSRDGGLIATGGHDQKVRLWDADDGHLVREIPVGGKGAVWGLAFDADGTQLAVGGDNKELQVFDPQTGDAVAMTMQHSKEVRTVGFSRDGNLIATGDAAGTVRVWNAAAGTVEDVIEPDVPGTVARSVAFSPTADFLAYTSDYRVRLWDLRNHRVVATSDSSALRTSVTFDPVGDRLAVGGLGGRFELLDAHTLQRIATVQAHPGGVDSIAFSPDGTRIVTGGDDNDVKVWDVKTVTAPGVDVNRLPDPDFTFQGHSGGVVAVGFARRGQRIVSASIDGTVREWAAVVGLPIKAEQGQVRAVAFSPDGTEVASGGLDGTIKRWNTTTGERTSTIGTASAKGDDSHAINSLAYSKDGNHIAVASSDGSIVLWETRSGRHVRNLDRVDPLDGAATGSNQRMQSVTFDPDGNRIAAGGFDGIVRLWDANTGKPIASARTARATGPRTAVPYQVWSVAFSPDGRQLLTGSGFDAVLEHGKPPTPNNLVQIWNADTLTPEGPPKEGNKGTTAFAVQFDGTGQLAASSSSDGTLQVWNLHTGQLVLDPTKLNGDQSPVYSLALAHKGNWIATGVGAGTVRVWNLLDKPPEDTPLQGHRNWVLSVAVSPNDKMIASGSADGNVRLWPGPMDVSEAICAKLTANPSRTQWDTWVQDRAEYAPPCDGLEPTPDP